MSPRQFYFKMLQIWSFLFFLTSFFLHSPNIWAESKEAVQTLAKEKKIKAENDNLITFSDKVKSIRSVAGDYDVFFNQHFGPYSVPFSLPKSKDKEHSPEDILKEAHKKGIAIKVTVDSATDTIVDIEYDDLFRKPASSTKQDLPKEYEQYQDIYEKYTSP